jgi:hypothetical protein
MDLHVVGSLLQTHYLQEEARVVAVEFAVVRLLVNVSGVEALVFEISAPPSIVIPALVVVASLLIIALLSTIVFVGPITASFVIVALLVITSLLTAIVASLASSSGVATLLAVLVVAALATSAIVTTIATLAVVPAEVITTTGATVRVGLNYLGLLFGGLLVMVCLRSFLGGSKLEVVLAILVLILNVPPSGFGRHYMQQKSLVLVRAV